MAQELHEIYKSMTPKMYSALTTGSHTGYTCIGKMVTLKALRRRGLIAADNRWTKLGWAMVLWIVATEPGWNPAYFKLPQDVHVEALAENEARSK
jgi:hypothetical protein